MHVFRTYRIRFNAKYDKTHSEFLTLLEVIRVDPARMITRNIKLSMGDFDNACNNEPMTVSYKYGEEK